MRNLECINGLEYHKVMFRNELVDLIRHETKRRVDYIKFIELHNDGGFTVHYYSSSDGTRMYYDKYNLVAKKINEFYKVEERDDKLRELGI